MGALYWEFREFMRSLTTFLRKTQKSINNSHKRPKHPNYDGFLWVFPRKVVRIRVGSLTTFLRKTHRNPLKKSHERPKHPNYDGFLWVFPRKVVRIRVNSRKSQYNAPAKKVSKARTWKTIKSGYHEPTAGFSGPGRL